MKRITKAALGGVAGCGLILGATLTASGESPVKYYNYGSTTAPVDLGDYSTDPGPFDDATATLRVMVSPEGADFRLQLQQIGDSAAGTLLGAHLHTKPCIDGDYAVLDPVTGSTLKAAGSQAGPHYNHDVAANDKVLPSALNPDPSNPAEISRDTEVWFDIVASDHGTATFGAEVPFVPIDDGIMSIVIHADHTNHKTGAAGARQACMPLDVSEWAPTPG